MVLYWGTRNNSGRDFRWWTWVETVTIVQWARSGSNGRPADYESAALTI